MNERMNPALPRMLVI